MFATMLVVSKKKETTWIKDYDALDFWPKCDFCEEATEAKNKIEEDFEIKVQGKEFPFYVPKEYAKQILEYRKEPDVRFVDPDGNDLDEDEIKELENGFYIIKEFLCHYAVL